MRRLVRESIINEGFTEEDSDPIGSMNIGGFSFETLRPGAIITAIVPHLCLNDNNNRISNNPSHIALPKNYPLLVLNVRNYVIPGEKKILLYKMHAYTENTPESKDLQVKELETIRDKLKEQGEARLADFRKYNLIINEKRFNRLFKIIERGF